MKKYFRIFILFLSTFLFFSCDSKRTDDGDLLFGIINIPVTDNPSISPSEHTKLLKKYSYTDTDSKMTTAMFNYSGSQLVSSRFIEKNRVTDFTLIYKGTQLSKITMETSGDTSMSGTFDLEYSEGRLIKANGVFDKDGEPVHIETTFDYQLASVSKIKTIYFSKNSDNSDTISILELTSNLSYSGNNLNYWKFTAHSAEGDSMTIPDLTYETSFSNFDTQKNPFNTLPKAFTLAIAHFTTSFQSIIGLSFNNFKKMSVMNEPATFNYEYNEDGYPINAASNQGTFVYEYIPR